jgi:hypothetical protein
MSNPDNTFTPAQSLPSTGVPATGFFSPVLNIATGSYNTQTGNTNPPYNRTLIGDSSQNLVGSVNKPYLQMALPSYIPTIYNNIYDIQMNLQDVIPTEDISDSRQYPTSYAVKNYVASQLFGSETLEPASGTTYTISTGLTTTALVANKATTSGNVLTTTVTNQDDSTITTYYTTYYDIDTIDVARSGSTKFIICLTDLIVTPDTVYNMQIRLTEDKYFVASGQAYKTYSFVSQGDCLSILQFINDSDQNVFFVTSYGGVFSDKIETQV